MSEVGVGDGTLAVLTKALKADPGIPRSGSRVRRNLASALAEVLPEWRWIRGVYADCVAAEDAVRALRRVSVMRALNAVIDQWQRMPTIGDGEFAMGYRAGLRTADQTFGRRWVPETVQLRPEVRRHLNERGLDRALVELPKPEEIRTRIHEVLTHRQLGGAPGTILEASGRLERAITTSVADYQEVQTRLVRNAELAGDLMNRLSQRDELEVVDRAVQAGIRRVLVPLVEVLQRDATAGMGYAAGYYLAGEHATRLVTNRLSTMSFPLR